MKIKRKNTIIVLLIVLLITLVIIIHHFSPVNKVFKGITQIANNVITICKNSFAQKEFQTYTSITDIKPTMKLVTAKQQLDFITIMDGKDGRYLEIATYEVQAGIDFKDISYEKENKIITSFPQVKILDCFKISSLPPIRSAADTNNSLFYQECIKPINIAYEQKACDYAVELGLLNKAKEGWDDTFKKMLGKEIDIEIKEYKEIINLDYLPLRLEISNTFLDDNRIEKVNLPSNHFNRDSLVLKTSTNDNWQIRFGDSGRTYSNSFDNFYNNVFTTNADKENSDKDQVEIFRYFDPMYPKESEILSYASDNYRTFFILNNGRIYYVDAIYDNQQTLIDTISPLIIYFATSIRKNEEKVENEEAYKTYISNYFAVQENIRTNASRLETKNSVDRLIKSNIIRMQEDDYSEDEKYLLATADIKLLGRTSNSIKVHQTNDSEFDDLTNLIKNLLVEKDYFRTDESRESALKIAAELDTKIYNKQNSKAANTQYLLSWFLDNPSSFELKPENIIQYTNDLQDGDCYVASRPLIVSLSDSERNKYFLNLFKNRLSMADYFVDTAGRTDDDLTSSPRGNNLFAYYKIPKFKEMVDGDVNEVLEKRMKQLNKDKYQINNSFILVFSQTEWDWGFVQDDDIHALVFDDATLKIFPNIGSQNPTEKIGSVLKTILGLNDIPKSFYYGDWRNLRVNPYQVIIGGQSFSTKKIIKKSKASYRNTNDYAEKSMIASFIDELQHAFSDEEPNYYYDTLCENLEYQTQRFVYDKIWRPSPRMILDTREDKQKRYNY